MGARESCGLIVFGRREGNYAAYGLTDAEGKFLGKLYQTIKTLKYQQVTYEDLLNLLKDNIEINQEILDTQMSPKLYFVWQEDLKPFLEKSAAKDTDKRHFNVNYDDFLLLWHRAIQSNKSKNSDQTGGCCGQRPKFKHFTEFQKYSPSKMEALNGGANEGIDSTNTHLYKPIAKNRFEETIK